MIFGIGYDLDVKFTKNGGKRFNHFIIPNWTGNVASETRRRYVRGHRVSRCWLPSPVANSIQYAAHRPADFKLTPPFLNFHHDTSDACFQCLGGGVGLSSIQNILVLSNALVAVNFGDVDYHDCFLRTRTYLR